MRSLSVCAVLALLPMFYVAIARIGRFEDSRHVVLLETFVPYLLLPAYGIAVFALATRQRALSLLALLMVVCHLMWVVVPEWRPAVGPSDNTEQGPSITLFSQNVFFQNSTADRIGDSIRESNADVVFLQEASEQAVDQIYQTGALREYPYRLTRMNYQPDAIGIWSKYPLTETRVVPTTKFPALRAKISVDGRNLVLWNIHTRPPPLELGTVAEWQGDMAAVRREIGAESGAVVAAGDFNAVRSHRPFRELLGDGWTEANTYLGRGAARTWPAKDGRIASLGGAIRLDHILARGGAEPTSIREMPAHGSDHRGLLATIYVS